MNPKHFLIGFVALGVFALAYENYRSPQQSPHSVQDTSGKTGEPLARVNVPELSERAKAGQVAFEANCASCHGNNAAGKDGFAPPLVHNIYRPNHHADLSFQLAVKNGVRSHHWRFGNMPPVKGISEDKVADIVVYVRELQRANGIN